MKTRANRSPRRGYTIVEVMSAMTLFAIGAAGVMTMQRVTIQGGDDARRFDMASNIAREWEHRLQRDSFLWRDPSSSAELDTATRWLHAADIVEPPSGWSIPPGSFAPGYGTAFDILGRDVEITDQDRIFCVQYRLGWIADQAGAGPTAAIRAEVRVFWSRLEYGPANCANLTVYETPATRQKHHFVFVTTAIRGNPVIR